MVAFFEKLLYVDDLFFRAGDDEKVLEIYYKLKRIIIDRGFNFRKWNFNL